METKKDADIISAKTLRRLLAPAVVLLVPCLVFIAPVSAAFTADTSWYAESESTFTLIDANDLAGLAQLVNGGNTFSCKTVKLGGDINLGNEEWTPIMSGQQSFSGTFDGAGHTVSGLSITENRDSDSYLGLFGQNSGSISNLSVSGKVDVISSSGTVYAGGLVGYSRESGSITKCFATGDVNAVKTGTANSAFVGGLVGKSDSSSISQSYAVCNVTASGSSDSWLYVGGLAGQQKGSSIEECFFAGNVTADNLGGRYVGGIVGDLSSSAQISNCYAVGTASDGQYVGGLAGNANKGTSISNSYALNKQVDGTGVGRIVGSSSGTLTGNSAWENMVGGSSGSATTKNGASISSEYIWGNTTTFSAWMGTVWEMNSNDKYNLPVLKALAKPVYDASYLDPDANKVTVTYDANGGSGDVPTDDTKYTPGSQVTVLGQGTLTYGSKGFAGWNTESDGSGINYIAGEMFTISADTTLYANWTDTPITYTVTYNVNGGSGTVPTDDNVYTSGNNEVTVIVNVEGLTKTGYTFNGWNTKSDGTGTNYGSYGADSEFTISADTTLYAKWSPILYYIDFHNGTETDHRQCTYDTETTFPFAFNNPGKTLLGWADEDGGEVKYQANPDGSVTLKNLTTVQDATVNLYAVWEGDTYTVTFDKYYGTAGGTMEPVSGLEYGYEYTLPECTFTNTGYTLAYWTTTDTEGTHTLYPGDKFTITQDTVFKAQWTEAQVTITFDTQGGTEISPISGNYTDSIARPADPTKTGYIFDG